MFECITLTNLGLYNESKEKLLKILSSANNDYLSYRTDQISKCYTFEHINGNNSTIVIVLL